MQHAGTHEWQPPSLSPWIGCNGAAQVRLPRPTALLSRTWRRQLTCVAVAALPGAYNDDGDRGFTRTSRACRPSQFSSPASPTPARTIKTYTSQPEGHALHRREALPSRSQRRASSPPMAATSTASSRSNAVNPRDSGDESDFKRPSTFSTKERHLWSKGR